uniref:CFA20 domain-containing protein n=1 Tax=Stegastes partitus TaxID=144197 RepID=A0A3B5AUI7_9TELE
LFSFFLQGGAVVEIFSGQGKDPVAKWKLCGGPSAIHKEYNKEVKGFVYCLEGSSQTVKMQIPENGKMSLGLLQRFLVLQVNIPQCSDFSAELVITDSEHLKRRLHMSTVHKELSATPLHAKIPFLCPFLSLLDGISLFATCKVRRIFTMKTEPTGTSDDAGLMDLIPRSCQYPPDVKQITQVLNMESLRKADMRTGLFSSDCGSYRRTRPQAVLHTASGSRASGPPPQTGRKSNASADTMESSCKVLYVGLLPNKSSLFLWVINLKEEEDEALKPVESSHYDLHLLGSLRIRGDDDEELRMLASLKREQEEDECRASGLSASQIHQCNVSISVSSDDTSTWTRISMVSWMDVLSPPIMPPSQQRRSGNTWSNRGSLSVNEDEDEDEYLNLLYDPCLNCYFDPKTGKYYELA